MRETILQFGAGRFLRAFVDRFVQEANDAGHDLGKVVVVQTTPGRRAELIGGDGYPVLIRGIEQGQTIDRVVRVRSISRAMIAAEAWRDVMEVAASPTLTTIVTNATEAGYQLSPDSQAEAQQPATMPGMLTQALFARFCADGSPLILLPCELIERNADKLRGLVAEQASRWKLPAKFVDWATGSCHWLNNLVDCIVTLPSPELAAAQGEPAAVQSAAAVQAEPFALWAIENRGITPPLAVHPAVKMVDQLAPYYLRKVRILNGLHTAMAARYLPRGFATVRQVLDDAEGGRWIRDVLWEEIVPVVVAKAEGVAEFADAVLERLRNSFVEHRLRDIAAHHAAKVEVRITPTIREYEAIYGRPPRRLSEAMMLSVG